MLSLTVSELSFVHPINRALQDPHNIADPELSRLLNGAAQEEEAELYDLTPAELAEKERVAVEVLTSMLGHPRDYTINLE